MAFGQENENYGNGGYNQNNNNEGNSIKYCWQDFPLSHLLKLSVVFQDRPKGYKSPIFAFFSVWPMGNNTYIKEEHITFMLEIPKLKQLAEALNFAVIGRIPQNKAYTNWAKPAIAANKGNDTEDRQGKKFSVYSVIQGNSVSVSLTFNRGKLEDKQTEDQKNYNEIPMLLNLAEAKSLAWYADFFASEARKLDFDFKSAAPGHVIRKKLAEINQRRREEQQNGNYQGQQSQQGGYQNNQQQQSQSAQQGYQQQQGNQQGKQGGYQQSDQQGNGNRQTQQNGQIPDQTLIMQAYPFLPDLEGVYYDVVDDQNGKFLKVDGNIQNNLKALIDAGFQYNEGDPFWWRVAAA